MAIETLWQLHGKVFVFVIIKKYDVLKLALELLLIEKSPQQNYCYIMVYCADFVCGNTDLFVARFPQKCNVNVSEIQYALPSRCIGNLGFA